MFNPGDVVIVDFPGAARSKTRPAVVVSTATYHATRPDIVVGVLTTKLAKAKDPTDYRLQDWVAAGLRTASAFRSYFQTVKQIEVQRRVGSLSAGDWAEVHARLRIALAVT